MRSIAKHKEKTGIASKLRYIFVIHGIECKGNALFDLYDRV